MSIQNSLTKTNKCNTFSVYMNQTAIKNKVNSIITGERGQSFMTAILSAVSNNQQLELCDHNTILASALLGETLKLSPSPQLGQYFLVPFDDTKKRCKVAQFQLGYKGYIQLAIRSGQYKKLNVLAIKEGELIKYDPLNEEIEVNLIDDEEERENAKTIGYYAMFEYINGFKKSLYWSKAKMLSHAKKYSQAYRSYLSKGNSYSFWSKDFDGMAFKTMLRQIISKWGIMSIEMQKAYVSDMAVIKDNGDTEYIDADIPDEAKPIVIKDDTAILGNGENENYDPLTNFE